MFPVFMYGIKKITHTKKKKKKKGRFNTLGNGVVTAVSVSDCSNEKRVVKHLRWSLVGNECRAEGERASGTSSLCLPRPGFGCLLRVKCSSLVTRCVRLLRSPTGQSEHSTDAAGAHVRPQYFHQPFQPAASQ